MEVTSVREVTPEQFELSCKFNAEDFIGVSPQLFFEIFNTPAWDALSDAEKIERAAAVARLSDQAKTLGVAHDPPILKSRLEGHEERGSANAGADP